MTEQEDKMPCLFDYESEGRTLWNWQISDYGSQEFESEESALQALRDGLLEFSTSDNDDVLGALYMNAAVNENLSPPFDYWLVDGISVREPSASGRVLGTLPDFRIGTGLKVLKLKSWEFLALEAAADGP